MALTSIQIKSSSSNSTPQLLNVAEPAYSYVSNTLFIGTANSDGAIAIGGQFYVAQQQLIYNTANASFLAANNAVAGTTDQTARNTANASFLAANNAVAGTTDQTARNTANASYTFANTLNTVNTTQNNSITAAFLQANAAFSQANAAVTNLLTITGGTF